MFDLQHHKDKIIDLLSKEISVVDSYFLFDMLENPTEDKVSKLVDIFLSDDIAVEYFIDIVFTAKKIFSELNILIDDFDGYFKNLLTNFYKQYSSILSEMIKNQEIAIEELSTPVVELWDRILALPIIGVLDSYRVKNMMENLLEEIMRVHAKVIIIDITGVSVVDTETANHLIKTAKAAELMGSKVIITGISPKIAQTLVHLGVDFGAIKTMASLKSGFDLALSILGMEVIKVGNSNS
ncbi:STAS domain-containing protein [Caldicellulosiruptoraceae bacterium PP1]